MVGVQCDVFHLRCTEELVWGAVHTKHPAPLEASRRSTSRKHAPEDAVVAAAAAGDVQRLEAYACAPKGVKRFPASVCLTGLL